MKLQEFSGVDWKKFRNIARFLSKITQKTRNSDTACGWPPTGESKISKKTFPWEITPA